LNEAKTEAEANRETKKKELKSKEEIEAKRIQNKLAKDKTPEMKDLLTKDETIKIANDDLSEKLKAEVAKFDKLLNEKQDL
jgi:hypothetical protein